MMEKCQRELLRGLENPEELARRFDLPPELIRRVTGEVRCRISSHCLKLIRAKDDPIYRQCIPDQRELENNSGLLEDPLGEERDSPAPNVVHRYPSHCLLLVSAQCATYCRFCTRKRKFRTPPDVSPERIAAGIDYIRRTQAIRDVLVSGGDPLLLTDDRLAGILGPLRDVGHLDIIRIGTRTPVMLPERITRRLTTMFRRHHPLYINIHINHPAELDPTALRAIGRLADAGIPLGSQTVLLRGINDSAEVLRELFRRLLAARVRPYYLLQCDLVYGISHFRTPIVAGLELMRELRGSISGLAMPHFIIDLPGGGGKVELTPDCLVRHEGRHLIFRNFRGDLCPYDDIQPYRATDLNADPEKFPAHDSFSSK